MISPRRSGLCLPLWRLRLEALSPVWVIVSEMTGVVRYPFATLKLVLPGFVGKIFQWVGHVYTILIVRMVEVSDNLGAAFGLQALGVVFQRGRNMCIPVFHFDQFFQFTVLQNGKIHFPPILVADIA